MDNGLGARVRVGQRVGNCRGNPHRVEWVEPLAGIALHHLKHRAALDILHDDIWAKLRVLAPIVNLDDIGMLQRTEDANLFDHSLPILFLPAAAGGGHLDGDLLVAHLVHRQIDRAHCAASQALQYLIPTN